MYRHTHTHTHVAVTAKARINVQKDSTVRAHSAYPLNIHGAEEFRAREEQPVNDTLHILNIMVAVYLYAFLFPQITVISPLLTQNA